MRRGRGRRQQRVRVRHGQRQEEELHGQVHHQDEVSDDRQPAERRQRGRRRRLEVTESQSSRSAKPLHPRYTSSQQGTPRDLGEATHCL